MQVDDIALVKRVAWKGRHKIQNKWEPSEYVVVEQPNLKVPLYRAKSLEDNKIRILIGICCFLWVSNLFLKKSLIMTLKRNIERQISEKTSQPIVSTDITPLAQSNLEHRQENISSDLEYVNIPVDHVDSRY